MTNLDLYITQDIPKKQSVFGEIDQKVIITSITVNWQSPTNPTIGLPQIIVGYEILQSKDGVDVSAEMKNKIKPKPFDNNMLVYQRSFEEETFFQPIPNPDFVEGESNEDERYLTKGAFDFIVKDLVLEHPHLLIPFLKQYIIDNYNDGWFDSAE